MKMRIDNAVKVLSRFEQDNVDELTDEELAAIDCAIANMEIWDEVKERLLLSLAKVNSMADNKMGEGYVRGVRNSLAMIDSILEVRIRDKEIGRSQ